MTAQVHALPVPQRLCGRCENVALTDDLWCSQWGEPVLDERQAEDCLAFSPTNRRL